MTYDDSKLTPMMRQYRDAKAEIPPDAVLLFRLGDFYEEFFEDAEKVSSTLELVLTKRAGVPMCGFPYHALDNYLPRLVAAGLKVAIADQMEDPKLANGIVKREITRIVTPGTVIDNSLLQGGCNNYLAALYCGAKKRPIMAAVDVSTGEFFYAAPENFEALENEFMRLGVKEALVSPKTAAIMRDSSGGMPCGNSVLWTELDEYDFDFAECNSLLCKHFGVVTLDGFGCREYPEAVCAAGAALRYVTENLRQEAKHVTDLRCSQMQDYLQLDQISLRNLEILSNRFNGGKDGTLLGALDRTMTSMGGRRLRDYLTRPLKNCARINERLDAVQEFKEDALTLSELRETIRDIRDLERIVGRLNVGNATPRDLQSLGVSLSSLPGVKMLLSGFFSVPVRQAIDGISDFTELVKKIFAALVDEPPALLADGGVIRQGYSAQLDELRSAATDGKGWLSKIQQREIERTHIKSLKVKFNSVFGYYIEVSKSNLDLVPEDYIRKQTLVNAERFITPELKELESKILGAEEKSKALEAQLFDELRSFATNFTVAIQRAADVLATIDVLAAFAECARVNGYVRPHVFDDTRLVIKAGRHPALDVELGRGKFVPNDCDMDGDTKRMMLITGPNMAGKSTYLRQTALLVIMAQAGSFVPAESAEIGLADRIFTRVGAGDDLSRGQSTFMVEMIETANILNHATAQSLVILDEIGRGTSTFDGLSIAWSVAEYLHDDSRCRTQFATHYHEMTELAGLRRGIRNFNVAVREYNGNIIFLRQIVPGASDRSYGIHVAKLAGLPEPVLERADTILALLEKAADTPRDAMAALPRCTVKGKRRRAADKNGEDDMIQLSLL